MFILSSNNPLLANSSQTDSKGAEDLEWSPVVQIEFVLADFTMSKKRHLGVAHLLGFQSFFCRFDELEVSGASFVYSAVEIECVAASSFVVAWLHVLKLVSDGVGVISNEIVERDSE